MKNNKLNGRVILLLSLAIFLFIVIVLLLSIYFLRIKPFDESQNRKIDELSSQLSSKKCFNVYSKSAGKMVCLSEKEATSEYLSECSRDFREKLQSDADIFKSIRDINSLEKIRNLAIKMCMQEKGINYESN